MMWLLGLLVLAVIGGIAVVAAGVGDSMAVEFDDRRDVVVPTDRPIRARDLSGLRFTTAFRGYRVSEVDALLDRLAAQLAETEPPPATWSTPPEDKPVAPAEPTPTTDTEEA